MANAKLIFVNVPSGDLAAARQFYRTLLGSDFGVALAQNTHALQQIISSDGIGLNITERHTATESVAAHFAVDNLGQSIQELEGAGGQVVVQPFDLPVASSAAQEYVREWHQKAPTEPDQASVGRAALVRDPDGNLVGLVELSYSAQVHYRAGPFRSPLAPDEQEANQRARQMPAS